MSKKSGFTLVEIMVAAIVFSLIILGLVSVFIAASKHIAHSRERMTSAQLGKFFIDPLQAYVRFDTWDDIDNELSVGTKFGEIQIINNRNFSEEHDISVVADTDLRRVTSTITWNEEDD